MNVFVYGTLLVPKIWETVTQTVGLASREAALPGYEIRRVAGASYPAIYAAAAAVRPVPGRVFFEVPGTALRRLDAYEDAFYQRVTVSTRVDGLGSVEAQAYAVPPDQTAAVLSDEGWTLAWFEAHGLEDFWGRVFGG